MAQFPDTPSYNPVVDAAIGYRTDATPSEDPVISPRIGFNWDPTGDGKQQLRGGIGIFAGRTPYVWISNAFANTGVESVSRPSIRRTGDRRRSRSSPTRSTSRATSARRAR